MRRAVVRRLTAAPASKQDTADERVHHIERIMHADDVGDEVKVDQEQNDSEIDERERSRHKEDSTHLQHEDDCSDQARLKLTENTHHGPPATHRYLKQIHASSQPSDTDVSHRCHYNSTVIAGKNCVIHASALCMYLGAKRRYINILPFLSFPFTYLFYCCLMFKIAKLYSSYACMSVARNI